MKILVTGANGFLGYYLVKQLLEKKYEVIATGNGACRLPFAQQPGFEYQSMNFTDPFIVHDIFGKYKPAIVVHAGANSKPDDCELNQWQAYITNVEGTVTMLLNAEEQKSFFVFISSDFVFDGKKDLYSEEDEPAPVNFYGKTKAEAEDAVKEYKYGWAIVRPVLVYGKPQQSRSNILSVVKEKLQKAEEYSVVDDQYRTPTNVEDLAAGIISIIEKKATGIFHIAGKDTLTPYEMAVKAAAYLGLNAELIKKVSAETFTQAAKRPPKTIFIIDKAIKELNYDPVSFEEGLKKTFS